jgi:glutamine synthetase
VRWQRRLPAPVSGDPDRLSAEEQARLGVRRLPVTLAEAADALAASATLRAALGDTLMDAVLAVRRAEVGRFRDGTPEDIVAALRWVY